MTKAALAAFVMAFLILYSSLCLAAETPVKKNPITSSSTDSTLTVSLITCYPGSEIYELCGHEAIRIRGAEIDSVWNYGLFSFNEPNFVYRFVKGETDYMVAGYPFAWFMPEYIKRGSRVVEQDLQLSPSEALTVLRLLRDNAKEENKYYRYNYVRDNCATRIVDIVEKSIGERLILRDSIKYGTYRQTMRHYHQNYPWYQFGIDLALGSGLDAPQGRKAEMFVPIEMMDGFSAAERSNGKKLVSETRVLYEGTPNAVLPPTPFYLTPLFWSIIVFLFSLTICIIDGRKKSISKPWYTLFFSLLGLGGCIITFLVFFSEHEATSPNILIYWLNPLQFIMAGCIWWRRTQTAAKIMSWIDIVVCAALLIVWPLQSQSTNLAVFPMLGATVALCVTYAIISQKSSYNKIGRNKKRSKAQKIKYNQNHRR